MKTFQSNKELSKEEARQSVINVIIALSMDNHNKWLEDIITLQNVKAFLDDIK